MSCADNKSLRDKVDAVDKSLSDKISLLSDKIVLLGDSVSCVHGMQKQYFG